VVWIPYCVEADDDSGGRGELGAFTSREEAINAGRIWQRLQAERRGQAPEVFYDVVVVYDTAADWLADR
jgi:hypothetical protein